MSTHWQAFVLLQLSHEVSLAHLAQVVPECNKIGHLRFQYQIVQRDIGLLTELVLEFSTGAIHGCSQTASIC